MLSAITDTRHKMIPRTQTLVIALVCVRGTVLDLKTEFLVSLCFFAVLKDVISITRVHASRIE